MYSLLHSILSEIILFVTFLIDMSFFTTTNVTFGLPLPSFFKIECLKIKISCSSLFNVSFSIIW